MNLHATIYEGRNIDVKFLMTPRDKNAESLLSRHKSKKGFESIVFNPLLSITFESRTDWNRRIIVPYQSIYQILGTMSKVYDTLATTKKLYIRDESKRLIIDKNLAAKCSKKISAYTAYIVFTPTVFDDNSGGDYGVAVSVESSKINVDHLFIGVFHHSEVRSLIEKVEHMDITTYAMACATAEKVDRVERKVDEVYDLLLKIQRSLAEGNRSAHGKQRQQQQPTFQWSDVSDKMSIL